MTKRQEMQHFRAMAKVAYNNVVITTREWREANARREEAESVYAQVCDIITQIEKLP